MCRSFVLVPAVAVLAGTAAFAVLMVVPGREQAAAPAAPARAPAPQAPRPSAFAWQLVGATSAERMMVLEVETARPAEALAIAQQLTEPYKKDYDEVLVFFFAPDAQPRLAFRRVQWTRTRGYRTLDLNPEP
ncbi:MAG TPA: hypothetical protein VK886_02510 [Vicinamibacterales bacterium]|nr:hypothetical protein [Vicinamibacterales bacterium]